MTEIFGWFDAQNRGALNRLIAERSVKTVIEVGSFLGLSSAWFAHRVDHVYCVDRFEQWTEDGIGRDGIPNTESIAEEFQRRGIPKDFFEVFRKNMEAAGCLERITPIRAGSAEGAALIEPADLIYIDAGHSYEDCAADIRAYLPKAKKVISGDDFVERDGFGVIRAVRELLPNHKSVGPFWFAEI